jgi:hypothetical protein
MTLEPVPEEYLYDYAGICWWCGAAANSREHKWKKSEIKAMYGLAGSGSYHCAWSAMAETRRPSKDPIRMS